MKRFWDWLKKLLSESFTGALTRLLTVFLSGVIIALLGVAFVTFVSFLSTTIPVPGYILVILVLFALIGVLIPVSKILNIFDDYKNRKMQLTSIKKNQETLEFEDFPRKWRAQVWKTEEGWHVENIEVYCSKHNLRLQLNAVPVDTRDARAETRIISVCSDCKRENVRYKENIPLPGHALHSFLSQQQFYEEIKSRFIRQIENAKENMV